MTALMYKAGMAPNPPPSSSPLRSSLSLSICLAAAVLAGACAQFAETPAPFPLEWRGIENMPRPSSPVAEGLRKHEIQIDRFVDHRSDPAKIGVVQKVDEAVRTSSNVADFCTARFSEVLTRAGAHVSASGAPIVIKPELDVFEVIEGGMFNGEAVIRVTALDNGKVVYEGTHAGKSKRWGRSRSPENYNEALSNALLAATQKLLEDDLFAKSLGAATSSTTGSTPTAAGK
jgi:hypothetical protein